MTAGDAMIEAIADAVAARLERIQTARRRLLTLEQAAEYYGASEDTIERLVANKKLVPVNGLDRRKRFDIRDLDRLIEEGKNGKWQ